ncbi:hypothetical protein SLE2022_271510 [Rubroshorea leprosula]
MNWVFLEMKGRSLLSPSEQPYLFTQPPPFPPPQILQSGGFNLNEKVSPSLLLAIIILAIIFFVSGLLHLLVRFFMRPSREPEDFDNVTALQGRLQQLFHLHDSGVDQSFIDTLPVFQYKAIIGLKNPLDCAVCLCEFETEDKLRLLPKCSHAFHMECIDTWLLSHSTCPLCRACLLPDFSPNNSCSPVVLVLDSGSESSRELPIDRENGLGRTNSVMRTNSHLGFDSDSELGSSARINSARQSCEIGAKDDVSTAVVVDSGEKVVPVKLGKFRNVDGGEGSSNNSVDDRRCYSMGSFEYVMDENSLLQVPIRTLMKKQSNKKPSLPLTPGHRLAMSECDCESRREFNGLEAFRNVKTNGNTSTGDHNGKAMGKIKRESFSISKIWLRGRKGKERLSDDLSRRAFSSRFPAHGDVPATAGDDGMKMKNTIDYSRSTISEIEFGISENGVSEIGFDEEAQSYNSLDAQPKTPSFARRTLLWLVGRQNKVVHSSFTPNF